MAKFFDAFTGERAPMRFDFGRAMTLRREADRLATPQPHIGDDWSRATASDAEERDARDMLPEGVSLRDGRFFADCCCCGRDCDVTEFIDEQEIDFTQWYGGCRPGCTP